MQHWLYDWNNIIKGSFYRILIFSDRSESEAVKWLSFNILWCRSTKKLKALPFTNSCRRFLSKVIIGTNIELEGSGGPIILDNKMLHFNYISPLVSTASVADIIIIFEFFNYFVVKSTSPIHFSKIKISRQSFHVHFKLNSNQNEWSSRWLRLRYQNGVDNCWLDSGV